MNKNLSIPLVSIIIPVYNVEKYLRKCLDSILMQSYPDWEALLIDDGSPDGSPGICDEYAAKDNRFRVFHQSNRGVSSARNVGLDNARGHWIWYVDPDDWITDNSLEILAETVSKNECDTVFFGIEYYDEQGNLISEENRDYDVNHIKDQAIQHSDYPLPNYLLRRDVVESNLLRFSEGIPTGEDLEFQYKYLMVCCHPVSINYRLYKCLRRKGSATRNDKSAENMAHFSQIILTNIVDFIIDNHIQESDWLAARVRRLFKSVLAANALVGNTGSDIQQVLRQANKRLDRYGFHQYTDLVVKTGVLNIRLYSLYFHLRRLFKK